MRAGVPVRLQYDIKDLLGDTPAPVQMQLLSAGVREVGMITGVAAGMTRGLCADSLVHAVQ
jgi:hypothetical protein